MKRQLTPVAHLMVCLLPVFRPFLRDRRFPKPGVCASPRARECSLQELCKNEQTRAAAPLSNQFPDASAVATVEYYTF